MGRICLDIFTRCLTPSDPLRLWSPLKFHPHLQQPNRRIDPFKTQRRTHRLCREHAAQYLLATASSEATPTPRSITNNSRFRSPLDRLPPSDQTKSINSLPPAYGIVARRTWRLDRHLSHPLCENRLCRSNRVLRRVFTLRLHWLAALPATCILAIDRPAYPKRCPAQITTSTGLPPNSCASNRSSR